MFGPDRRGIAPGHVIRDEVNEDFESFGMSPCDERLELLEPPLRLVSVIGRNIEVVADGIRAAGHALEQIGIVGRFADIPVVRRGGLLEDAGHPNVGETHCLELRQRHLVEVAELARAVLLHRATRLARLVRVAKKSRQKLVNAHLGIARCGAPGAAETRTLFARLGHKVVTNRLQTGPRWPRRIDRPVEPPPTFINREVFEINRDVHDRHSPGQFFRYAEQHLRRF